MNKGPPVLTPPVSRIGRAPCSRGTCSLFMEGDCVLKEPVWMLAQKGPLGIERCGAYSGDDDLRFRRIPPGVMRRWSFVSEGAAGVCGFLIVFRWAAQQSHRGRYLAGGRRPNQELHHLTVVATNRSSDHRKNPRVTCSSYVAGTSSDRVFRFRRTDGDLRSLGVRHWTYALRAASPADLATDATSPVNSGRR